MDRIVPKIDTVEKMENTLSFFGDVFLPSPVGARFVADEPFVFNMEYPITERQDGISGKINLKSERNYIENSFGRKPLAVCLANNHIMDYGEQGFLDTIAILRREGIAYFGAGYSKDNCSNPALVTVGDRAVALLGYVCPSTSPVFSKGHAPGVLPVSLDRIISDIRSAKHLGVDRIVVSFHWGAEEVFLPKPEDILVARATVDAGADLIIGHHAHRIQPFEVYKGRYIFYGLGNCVMPDLDVPAYFSSHGLATAKFKKRQNRRNKYSLAVSYDVELGGVKIDRLLLDGNSLRRKRVRASRLKLTVRSLGGYSSRFRRSFVLGKFRASFGSFLEKRRLPRFRDLLLLLSLARDRNYK